MKDRDELQRELDAEVTHCHAIQGDLKLCSRRVRNLERGIQRFLEANAAGEMGNRDKAIEHLEHLMSDI